MNEGKMFKKFIVCLALFATMSFAVWDNVPILKDGSGQVAGKIAYTTQDPLSGVALAIGTRYSVKSWLELSAVLPFGFYTYESKEGDQDYSGLMNAEVGVRFQISQGFSLFADALVPGGSELSSDEFGAHFGLQHSNLFTHVTWAKYIGYMYGNDINQYFYFGTELQFLFNQFSFYGEFRIIIDESARISHCSGSSYSYHCDETGGNNGGTLIALGFKIDATDEVTIDASVEFGQGGRFTQGGLKDPFSIGVAIIYNF